MILQLASLTIYIIMHMHKLPNDDVTELAIISFCGPNIFANHGTETKKGNILLFTTDSCHSNGFF